MTSGLIDWKICRGDSSVRQSEENGVLINLAGGVFFLGLIGVLLFGCAGRVDLPMFWAYLGVWGTAHVVGSVVSDPTLAKERLRPGPGGKFFVTDALAPVLWAGQYVVAGLDVGRFHWSDSVPLAVQFIGLGAMAAGLAVGVWAVAVNRFFSTAVRIQTDRGHRLVTGGPYRFVRHPGYACCPFIFIGGGLALGSWLAAVIGLVMFLPILWRTVQEDRFLLERLEGYAAYAQKVRYRLLPGVW
jgi:protein-S-isoprenylcysteine O-methyltransferase Ste14